MDHQQYVALRWSNYDNFINECHINQKPTDVTLACDGQRITAHREILSAVSPFFNIILKDIDQNQYPVIIITDLTFEDIESIVQFLYSGEVITPVNRIRDLAKAADKLQIKSLIDGTAAFGSTKRSKKTQKRPNESALKEDKTVNCDNEYDTIKSQRFSERQLKIQKKKVKQKNQLNEKFSFRKRKPTKRLTHANAEQQLVVIPEKAYTENTQITIDPSNSIATIASSNHDGTTVTTVVKVLPIMDTVMINTPTPVFCDNCGVLCQNESILRGHKKIHSEHEKESHNLNDEIKKYTKKRNKLHVCPFCPYSSEHNTNVAHHIRTHTGEKPHCCETCGRTFTRKETLNHHMRSHTGERPFKCTVCSKRFLFKHNLTSHMILHSGEKNHICTICSKSFALKTSLKKHFQRHKYIFGTDELYLDNSNLTPQESDVSIDMQQNIINVSDNIINTLSEINSSLDVSQSE